MMRRKLFLYTSMYAAGITAGFFVFERNRSIEASGLMISLILTIILTDTNTDEAYHEVFDQRTKMLNKQKLILIIMLISGLLMFSFHAFTYDSSAAWVSQQDRVKGRIISVQIKDDAVKMIVKTKGKQQARIIITIKNEYFGSCIDDPADAYELVGAVIEAGGDYKELEPSDNPGCFDYKLYMRSKGVSAGFKVYHIEICDPGSSIITMSKRYLYRTRESFIRRFDEDYQGFIRGVIFGDKSDIDGDMLKEFNYNSTGHILAVSGLHMGFLYSLLQALTGRKKSPLISFSIMAIILLYGEMTLWSPATVRACIVLTISLLSVHFRRRSDLLTSVGLAAFIILTYEPYQLFNSGFQMSFLALLGIAFLTKPVSMLTGEALGVMLSVQAGTLPVTSYTFGRCDPLSIFINVPIILLSSVLVPLCILLLMIESVFNANLMTGIDLAELVSFAVVKTNHILSFNGEFSFTVAGYGTMALIVFYMLIFAISSEWMRIRLLRKDLKMIIRTGVILMMPVIMLSACLYDRLSDDEIVFVAVGQGDCTHIRVDDNDILIDGGGVADRKNDETDTYDEVFNTGERILMPYLLREGVKDIDIALVTHLHTDHYKGIAELSEVYPIGTIGIPIDYRGSASEERSFMDDNNKDPNRPGILYIKPDTKINLSDDVEIEVLWPLEVSRESFTADDPNEHNTVYMIDYEGIKIMVTGDMLEEDELEMVKHYEGTDKLRCDILKVAHHGSKSSSSEEFLDAASPKIAVIQVGRNNFYGHPHKQTLERLEERGIKIFRTDLNGAVGIDIRRKGIKVDLHHNEQ